MENPDNLKASARPAPDPAEIKTSYSILDELLKSNINTLKWVGAIALVLSIGFASYVYYDIKNLLDEQVDMINDSPHPSHALTYLIYRITTLGAIAAFILYIGFKVTIASFDQAMRFTKREMGTAFLNYMKTKYDNQTTDQLHSFETWNKTVESAFSNVKTEAQPSANINVGKPEIKS